jgi:hypothetical protein
LQDFFATLNFHNHSILRLFEQYFNFL